jgi:peptide/nickel transport system substrate-binding protein
MRKLPARLVLVGVLALVIGMFAAPAVAQDDTLVITTLSDINSLDPAVGYDTLSWPAIALFYRGLVQLSDPVTPEPALAESWEISEDGLVYTFTLREGIMFSNGRAITPEDVKYTFERLHDPETASPTAYFFDMIEGVAEYVAGDADEISGIDILDERTVQFTLTRPEWTLMQRFSLAPGMIVAREGVEAAENFGREPLGAGPYVLESWDSGVRMVLRANENYWKEGLPVTPNIQIDIGVDPSVGVLRIDSGEADLMLDFVPNSEYPRIASDPVTAGRLLEITAFPNTQYIIPNVRTEPFTDLNVRMALSMAIDRDNLIRIYNNRAVPASGPVPPNVPGDNTDLAPMTYDPEAAAALLAEAGYADGITTQIYATTDPTDVAIMQAVVQDWAAIGVNAELISVEFSQWIDLAVNTPEDMPMSYIGWFMDYQDPGNVIEPLVTCAGTFNPGGYCDETLDEEYLTTKLIPPGDARWEAFGALEARLAEEVPNINLLHVINYYYTSERVQDIGLNAGFLLDLENASVGG